MCCRPTEAAHPRSIGLQPALAVHIRRTVGSERFGDVREGLSRPPTGAPEPERGDAQDAELRRGCILKPKSMSNQPAIAEQSAQGASVAAVCDRRRGGRVVVSLADTHTCPTASSRDRAQGEFGLRRQAERDAALPRANRLAAIGDGASPAPSCDGASQPRAGILQGIRRSQTAATGRFDL